jgi:hypothetical protein
MFSFFPHAAAGWPARRKLKGKMMKEENDLKERTKQFALRIIRLFGSLPKTTEAQILGKQLLRSGTETGHPLLHSSFCLQTSPGGMRRAYRHLCHDHQTGEEFRKSVVTMRKEDGLPLLHSSFCLQTFNFFPHPAAGSQAHRLPPI